MNSIELKHTTSQTDLKVKQIFSFSASLYSATHTHSLYYYANLMV